MIPTSREEAVMASGAPGLTPHALTLHDLTNENQCEVLAFLAERPVHTVFIAGFIRDNSLASPLNRGTFYACRDREGRLEGVALIGHATLIEARTNEAMKIFARVAQSCRRTHVIMGEQEKIARFWGYYADNGQAARRLCRELLFELREPVNTCGAVDGLRPATPDEIELVVPVQAHLAFEESGINPLEVDALGFRQRCARRIGRGRTWVLVERGKLIFKAEIMSETPEATYIEGVYVNPEERGQGYGIRCMSQLARNLLKRSKSMVLLANEQNREAVTFYRRAGYNLLSYYDTIFLHHQKSDS